MAGKSIKRKELESWIYKYATSQIVCSEERHIDSFIYNTVKEERWVDLLWKMFCRGKSYINRINADVKIGIYACIKLNPNKVNNPNKEDFHFSFDLKRMPPSLWLYRGLAKDNLFKDVFFSEQIANLYGMQAWLHHWSDDPHNVYYLYLTNDRKESK